jgi:hypothetical protein
MYMFYMFVSLTTVVSSTKWKNACYFNVMPSTYCNNSANFVCNSIDPIISNYTAAKMIQTLVMNSPEKCVDKTSIGLSVGIVVIDKMNEYGSSYIGQLIKQYSEEIQEQWSEFYMECNVSILLFVSCEDFYMYETLGPNTSNIVDYRCHHVFDVTEPIYNNKSEDCFSGLIEQRITAYRQIIDGNHPCYNTARAHRAMHWIILAIIIFCIMWIATFNCIIYRILLRRAVGPTVV